MKVGPPSSPGAGSAVGEPARRRPTSRVDGRTTRWNDHKAARRQVLVDAAIELIGRDGIEVGVQQIARYAGLPRSVVYRVFTDRSDLDEQIRAGIIEQLTAELEPALQPEGTLSGAVERAIRTYMNWIAYNPRLHQFLSVGSARNRTTDSPVVTGSRRAIAHRLTDLLKFTEAESATERMTESIAFGLVGFVDSTINHWLAQREPESDTEMLMAFLVRAVSHILIDALASLGIRIEPDSQLAQVYTVPAEA